MQYFFVIILSFSLTACVQVNIDTDPSTDIGQFIHTASGTFHAGKNLVGDLVRDATETKEDVENRIDKVRTGIEMMQEGKDLIDEGLGRE